MSFIIIVLFLINGAVSKVGQKAEIEVLRHNSQELIHKENIVHRELAASATSTPATITTSDTITVTATDTDGAGQLYEISFNNECTVSAPGLTCTAVGGQEQVLDSSSTSSMTDNGDGTYTSTISVTRPGKITINVFKYTQGGVLVEYYSGTTYSGGVQHAEIRGDLNIDYGSGNLFGSTSDSVSAKMYFKLKGPSTESITLQLEADDTADLSLGGSSIVSASIGTNTNTFSSTLNTMYDGQINFVENTATAKVVLSWSYTSVAMTTVPGTNLYYKAYVSSPMQLTINCPDGYSKTTSAGRPVCETVCGDSKRAGSEECDDGNIVATVDGCTSLCAIDSGWECHGGTPTAQDTCTQCAAGYAPNAAKDACVTTCGDGKRAGSEECDDANTSGTTDGCSASCTIDSGWECHNGNPTTQDTCTQCAAGYSPNAAKNACVTTCGDSKKAGLEECDDGNTSGTTDGCSASCTIDSGWECHGGDTTTQDTCTQCAAGYAPNGAKNACVTTCGDGKRAGAEECDDGNILATVDGCSSSCVIDSGWECHNGNPTTSDTCTQCAAGYSPNAAKNACVTVCGDGKRAGTEECDDGNALATVDGCSATCTIDSGWECHDGTPTAQDTCTQCAAGYSPNAAKNACVTVCGDGKRAGTEECDDGNTLATVDGCSSTCSIDSGWECHNGNPTTQDTCTQCPAGFYPNSAKNACETNCGDGKRAGSETCDDNNVRNGDGCTGTCTIESNWICNGGTTSSSDSCTFCEPGYTANNVPATQVCVSTCGDKMQVGSEKCDDGNTNGSDGCAADCSAVESGWVCANSTFSSGDVCTQCTSGFYQNDATYPTACVPQCGDSKRAGSEKCDNGDTSGATGCSSDCLSITAGWVCTGGTTTTTDTCTQCTAGFYQNDATNPTTCVPQCGDGLETGTEKCDDGNTVAGDGCAADCTTVEAGWVCSGGSTTSKDECYKCADGYTQNNAANPTTCVTTCGDGFEAGTEKCDDGNISGSDGCAADCSTVEAGWVCIGGSPTSSDTCTQCTAGFYQNDATNPETCVTTCGDGLEAGAEKCDDGNTIANDGCAADCTSVDAGWVCSGGSTTSQDTCTKCPDGFYQNNPTNPEVCVTLCGDGFEAGTEKCDDGNTINDDGCAADCTTVESGWVCKYGTPTTADVCEQCTAGYVQNDSSNPEYCVPSCGDGLRVGNELCDDANTSSNDGCSSDCSKIESGYICTGGSTGSKDTCTKCPLSYSPNEEQRKCEINPISTRAKQISYFYAIVSGVGLLLNIFMILKYNHSYISIFRTIFHIQMLYLLPLLGDKMGNDGVGFLRNFKFILATFNELPNDWVFFGWRSMFSSLDYSQENSYLPLIGIKSGSAIVNCYNLVWVSSVLSLLTGVSFLFLWKPKYPDFAKKMLKVLFRLAIRIIMLAYIFIAICAFSEVRDYKRVSKGFLSYLLSITFSGVLIFTVALCAYFWLRKIPAEEQVDTSFTIEYFVGVRKDKLARSYIILWFIRRTAFVGVIFMLDYLNNALILTILVLIQLFYILALLQTRAFTTKKDNILEVFNEICYLLLIPASLYYGPSLKMVDHSMIYLFINIAQTIIEFIVCLSEITIRLKKKMKVIKPDETIEVKRKTLAAQSMTSDRIIHSKNIYDRDNENVGINNYATQENPPSENSQNMSSANSQNSQNVFTNNSTKQLHTIQEVEEIPDKSEIQVPDVSDPKIYEEFKKNWGFGQYKSQKDKFSNFS